MSNKGLFCILLLLIAIAGITITMNNSEQHKSQLTRQLPVAISDSKQPSLSANTLTANAGDVSSQGKNKIIAQIKKLHVPFTANQGQTDGNVKFYARIFGGTVFVTEMGEIVYTMAKDGGRMSGIRDLEQKDSSQWPVAGNQERKGRSQNPEESYGVAFKESLVGAKVNEVKGEGEAITKISYFRGNDQSKWKRDIPTYDTVNLGEVYKGIELKLKAYDNNVEKLFYVKPDAPPETIKVQMEGAKNVKMNESGELVIETELGSVKFTKPIAYQEIDGKRVNVSVEYAIYNLPLAGYALANDLSPVTRHSSPIYGFNVGDYDKSKELVIDPLLASTFLGGDNYDDSYSIAVDKDGNVYVSGVTNSSNFPKNVGSLEAPLSADIYVAKFNSDLTELLASTYFGGSEYDIAMSMVIDNNGNILVAGETHSFDFPVTDDAYDTQCGSDGTCDPYAVYGRTYYYGDIFVSKLSNDLSALLASTFFGGSRFENVTSMAIDVIGDVYITGKPHADDFPATSGAYNQTYNDIFISKLSGDLTILIASTFFGGGKQDDVHSLALDAEGNVYITGETRSLDLPTTAGAYAEAYVGGYADAFISKFSGDLTTLLSSTYIGGSAPAFDKASSLTIDSKGNVYIAGITSSYDFPTTGGSYSNFYDGIASSAFIAKLNGDLTTLLASTFLNGDNTDEASAISVDLNENIYVAGTTYSTDFPGRITPSSKIASDHRPDIFISRLDHDLTALLASTCFGGNRASETGERLNALAIDLNGNAYVTGVTTSPNFPVTKGAYDKSFNKSLEGMAMDAFVTKFDSNLSTYAINTSILGSGWGTIKSTPLGISCGSLCSEIFVNNLKVSLRAEAGIGSGFQEWGGACSGKGKCIVKMDADKTVTASFIKFDPQISTGEIIQFGKVKANNTREKTIKITNKGKGVLSIIGISVVGNEFSINWTGQEIIKPKSSLSVPVMFNPIMAGPVTAQLAITSNDPINPTKTIALRGSGL